MKKQLFIFSALLAMSFHLPLAEARIMMGDTIIIDNPSFEEIFSIGDEILVSTSLQNEFIGVARKITAFTDIEKDFIALAMKIDFSGKANRDVYLFGNNIKFDGSSAGSINAFGRNIKISATSGGNLRAGAENIEIEGQNEGKTTLWGKNIFIRGDYNDLVVHGTNVIFSRDINIAGNLTYNTPEKKDLSHLNVAGEILWNQPLSERIKERTPLSGIRKIYTFFSLLFPVLITLWFFPNLFKQTTYLAGRNFVKCFFGGALLIGATLIAIPVIFITIVGAPLGLIVTSLFLTLIYISRVFPSIFLGRAVFFKLKDSRLLWALSTFTGVLFFTLVSLNPTAKIVLNAISIPAGFGALFMGRVNLIKRLRREKIL